MRYNATKIKKVRERLRLKQADLADMTGETQGNVSKKESGEAVTTDQLQKIADKLKVDLSEFYDFDGTENIESDGIMDEERSLILALRKLDKFRQRAVYLYVNTIINEEIADKKVKKDKKTKKLLETAFKKVANLAGR